MLIFPYFLYEFVLVTSAITSVEKRLQTFEQLYTSFLKMNSQALCFRRYRPPFLLPSLLKRYGDSMHPFLTPIQPRPGMGDVGACHIPQPRVLKRCWRKEKGIEAEKMLYANKRQIHLPWNGTAYSSPKRERKCTKADTSYTRKSNDVL